MLVAVLVTVTSASGIEAPVGSVILPRIVPAVSCALADKVAKASSSNVIDRNEFNLKDEKRLLRDGEWFATTPRGSETTRMHCLAKVV
jgi:hypothetical protein